MQQELFRVKSLSMKAHFVNIIVLVVFAFACQSCATFNIGDQQGLVKGRDYQSGKMPFTMRTSALSSSTLSKKKELDFGVSLGGGLAVNAAYAISDKIGLYVKGAYRRAHDVSQEYDYPVSITETYYDFWALNLNSQTITTVGLKTSHGLDQPFIEVGSGVFSTRLKSKLHLEGYGGISIGKTYNTYTFSPTDDNYDVSSSFIESRSYLQGFAQGNIGYEISVFQAVLMNRISYFNFYHQTFELDYPIETYKANPSALLLEEGIRVSAGKHLLKLYFQYEASIPLISGDVKWYQGNLQLGITFRFFEK